MKNETRLLKLPEVLSKTKKSRTSVLIAVRKGLFPQPFRLGGRSVAWLAHQVGAWIAPRAEALLAKQGGGHE